jgi:hypothetical protein
MGHQSSPVILPGADTLDQNNNFYDNSETYSLPVGTIEIIGEVKNPGVVDLSRFPKRSVIVKEALLNDDGSNRFVGAYRYDGYSLFDILTDRIPDKKNKEEFRHVIDLYVEIENASGEKVVLSWGEIFYPTALHQVLIAAGVARIVPSKTKDLWPLPKECKLVVANDLLSERNISNPVRITVKSYGRSIPVNRDLNPLWAPEFRITEKGKTLATVSSVPAGVPYETVHTVFYGRGRGIHSTNAFRGVLLKDILGGTVPADRQALRQGIAVMVGADGYRSVFSLGEILNRNDQAAVLLVPCDTVNTDGGRFRIFPGCDFFSDRAVKSVSEIIIDK